MIYPKFKDPQSETHEAVSLRGLTLEKERDDVEFIQQFNFSLLAAIGYGFTQ